MSKVGKSTGKGHGLRSAAKLLERRKRVFALWSAGNTQTAVAKSLKVSQQTVSLDILLSLKEWREEHRGSINEHVERELSRLFGLELEAEAEYYTKPRGKRDARFHDQMIRCGIERRKLLGIDRPVRTEVSAVVTHSTTFKTIDQLDKEIAEAFVKLKEAGDSKA